MATLTLTKRVRVIAAIVTAIALGPSDAQAVTVTLLATDAYGYSSFNTAGNWSNGAPPSSGNAYVDTGFVLRTPPLEGGYTFGGAALTINGGGVLALKQGNSVTINNLTLDNATVANWSTPLASLYGSITLGSGGAFFSPDLVQQNIVVFASMSGSGGITTQDGPGMVTLGGANTYSGGTTVSGGSVLQISSDAQLGSVPSSPAINITLNGGQLYNNGTNDQVILAENRNVYLGTSGGYIQPGWAATLGSAGFTVNGQISGPGSLGVAWDLDSCVSLRESKTGCSKKRLKAVN